MPLTDLYAFKAEKYARHRWDYAPEAVETILNLSQVNEHSVIADIGAGPGNLAKHFLDRVERVYLVEPNAAMCRVAEMLLGTHPACRIVPGRAEATSLPEASSDLITVGQALHYFEADTTRVEFARILKPGGWLAVLRNYGDDEALNAAIADVYSEENGCDPTVISSRPAWKPMDFYFGGTDFHKLIFPFVEIKTREQFIGALGTASYAPDENHPLYPRFEAMAGDVFDRFNRAGILYNRANTELYLGQMQP